MSKKVLETQLSELRKDQITNRDNKYKAADLSCIKAIAQAAINVELFTIPLYMTGLYSIQGTHAIGDNSGLYPGRLWPGLSATAGYIPQERELGFDAPLHPKPINPLSVNQQVFNGVYSVFIEEMLHLQLASNMASKLGITPTFTSPALMNTNFGWSCYANQGAIPHILQFKDCDNNLGNLNSDIKLYFETHFPGQSLQDMRVNATELSKQQTVLFLLIEETEENAKDIIQTQYLEPGEDGRPKYFENAPFDWWESTNTEENLPLFGSIGHMYECYWNYIQIKYEDGSCLLDNLLNPVQRDYFNSRPGDENYEAQFPKIKGSLNSKESNVDRHTPLKMKLMNNINAITDQGEGKGVAHRICKQWDHELWAKNMLEEMIQASNKTQKKHTEKEDHTVKEKFQPSESALKTDYPGSPEDTLSGSACARITNKYKDHFLTFKETLELIVTYENSKNNDRYITWNTWFEENNSWTSAMLDPSGEDEAKQKHPDLPSVNDVVTALNNLRETEKQRKQTHTIFSQSAVGTIKGLTTALDRYWSGKTNEFPGPAMGGSGDRISICWATTGCAPDLVSGIESQQSDVLYHACQGMSYTQDNVGMPPAVVYHSCKGSNDCKAQGGCGFVHSTSSGGSCGSSGAKGLKSAPADNKCNNLGGCAVPISASQLFPKLPDDDSDGYKMQLFEFIGPEHNFKAISYQDPKKTNCAQQSTSQDESTVPMPYKEGDAVYDIAWQAYCNANKLVNKDTSEIPSPPKPDDIRVALPPST